MRIGLYRDVVRLLATESQEECALGVEASVCAGDADAAGRFLRSWRQHCGWPADGLSGGGGPGGADARLRLAEGCAQLVSGRGEALDPTEQLLSGPGASTRDYRMFAVAAAHHDLHRAGVAAARALEDIEPDPALAAVAAADLAADREPATAVFVLETAAGSVDDADPVPRALELLDLHQHTNARYALAAVGAQMTLPPQRHEYWVAVARRVLPRPAVGRWVTDLAWLTAAAVAIAKLNVIALGAVLALRQLWAHYRPLPGLDRQTSTLVRSYRDGPWSSPQFTPADAFTFLAGAIVGMVAVAPALYNASDAALAVALTVGLAGGGVGAALIRRRVARRLQNRRQAADRDAARKDLRCRCLAVAAWVGDEGQHYVRGHLQPETGTDPPPPGPTPTSWRVLVCPQTHARYLNLGTPPAAVRLPAHPGPDHNTYPVPGLYL